VPDWSRDTHGYKQPKLVELSLHLGEQQLKNLAGKVGRGSEEGTRKASRGSAARKIRGEKNSKGEGW